ncbi:MAG TPA: hypothetical protein DCP63_02480 [Bacteroidetes bacterium]|nr:hypothetical protein [Bacteroidota bacterium]
MKRISYGAACIGLLVGSSFAQTQDTSKEAESRPFVAGGYFDKPFMTRLFGRIAIGGYMEAVWKYERSAGITEAVSFEARRFNIFTHSVVSDRIRVASELEFEHGTEEVKLEFAFLDFEIHPAMNFRGGILLSPIGRFNLAHDSPLNDLTERPLVSTRIIPTALSEAGMGFYGAFFPSAASRVVYEIYAVNGLHDGVITLGEGTRIPGGRGEFEEDNNQLPSVVGRVAYSPMVELEIGASLHAGPYNRYKVDQFTVDEKRNVTITAIDWEFRGNEFDFLGEAAHATIEIPPSLRGLFAERQQGIYGQVNYHFGRGLVSLLPHSIFTVVGRFEFVDFDTKISGDAEQRASVGLNFRPIEDTVFKLDYHHDWHWSRVNVRTRSVGINMSVASYF